jgi:hypothetical protein
MSRRWRDSRSPFAVRRSHRNHTYTEKAKYHCKRTFHFGNPTKKQLSNINKLWFASSPKNQTRTANGEQRTAQISV